VVGRDRNVRRAALHHVENRPQYAAHGGYFTAILVPSRRHRVVMPEQFVGTIDQMNLQMTPRSMYRTMTDFPSRHLPYTR
jgi:hypothetical protein